MKQLSLEKGVDRGRGGASSRQDENRDALKTTIRANEIIGNRRRRAQRGAREKNRKKVCVGSSENSSNRETKKKAKGDKQESVGGDPHHSGGRLGAEGTGVEKRDEGCRNNKGSSGAEGRRRGWRREDKARVPPKKRNSSSQTKTAEEKAQRGRRERVRTGDETDRPRSGGLGGGRVPTQEGKSLLGRIEWKGITKKGAVERETDGGCLSPLRTARRQEPSAGGATSLRSTWRRRESERAMRLGTRA